VEYQSWADDEGEEQSGVELIGGTLWVWRGETGEGNERGEDWGVLLGGFYRVGRRGGGWSRESNGGGRWCSLKAAVSRNQRATRGETVGCLFQERRG
jgi:hypothetical protein